MTVVRRKEPIGHDPRLSKAAAEASVDVIAAAEKIQLRSIQDMALDFAPAAIETLGKFARGKGVGGVKPTAQVTRAAARDIVEFAGGRPETRDPRIGDGSQNLTIILERKSDGTIRKLIQPIEDAVEATFREAESLVEAVIPRKSIRRKFLMPESSGPLEFEFEDD